jgi:hypothetical protein
MRFLPAWPTTRRSDRSGKNEKAKSFWEMANRSAVSCLGHVFMEKKSYLTRIVVYQNLGFLAVIVICYFNELLKLTTLIFSDHPFAFVYRRPTLEMLLFLAVWLLVNNSTRRLLKRVRHLEDFLRVCAWCRRIDYKGEWMRLEDFMQQGFDTPTTHGICPECLNRQKEAIERAKIARKTEAVPN